MSNKQSRSSFNIFYQSVRGLRTKQFEFYDNVSSTDYNRICLSEAWLNEFYFDLNLFRNCYIIFRSDRKSVIKTGGGGALMAVNSRYRDFKQRFDLQIYEQCVWVELPTTDGENLLIGNHHVPPDTSPNTVLNYFSSLENKLDTRNYRVVLTGDFNTPGFDWKCGLPQQNCHYSKLKGDAICTSTCLLGLTQSLEANHSNNLLDLVFC
jgi:hypothetical protein